MYQIGTIISRNKNRNLIANELGVAFTNNTAVFEQYTIELNGPLVCIKCNQINNIIQVKNFVNRISRILFANDEEVNRTIRQLTY